MVISSGPQSSLAGSPTAWLGAVQLLCLSVVSAGDTLVVPLLAKWIQTSDIMTLFCPTHSACLTLSAAIVWAHSTPASKLKCPFALGDEACVWVGRAVEQSFVEMLWKRSFGGCVCGHVNYWHIQWVLSSFNFLLVPKASQEFVLFCQTEWKPWLFENNPFSLCWFLQWRANWRDSRRERERCVSFGEDSEKHRGEWSLILSIGTSRLARSAVSEL